MDWGSNNQIILVCLIEKECQELNETSQRDTTVACGKSTCVLSGGDPTQFLSRRYWPSVREYPSFLV